jgi:predicted acyltransferase
VKDVGQRIDSLDVFRGLAGAAMILVNNPGNWGAVYPPLVHANWDGATLADVVFPSFVFIIGVTLPFTFAQRRERANNRRLLRDIVVRGAVLFGLGLVLNAADGFPALAEIRVPGVLQRIALSYVLAAIIVLDTGPMVWLTAAAALLGVHWAILAWLPFDGFAGGTMTAAHNVAGFIDAAVFGQHLLAPSHDPEGLLGTLSTAASILGGALAGAWLRAARQPSRRFIGLLVGGTAALCLGLLWATVLPQNKSLWTGSYAVTTAGIAALIFAVCYYLVDVRGVRWFAPPLVWLGVNPLAIYFLSELARHLLDYAWIEQVGRRVSLKDVFFWRGLVRVVGDLGGPRSSLAFALLFAVFWIAVAGALYRRGIRIRV